MDLARVDMHRLFSAAALGSLLLVGGCAQLSYYLQSVNGQMQILELRQPIAAVIANPDTPPELRAKLARVIEIRNFAGNELKLPDNKSYRGYANLQRPFVVWNVFATGEFSIEPDQSCFPIAGCVGYRGFFAQSDAEAYAGKQRALGLDVYVGGVPAYSTLGWFDDPVLNTFINYPEYEVARLIFHELAHQTVYVKNDSEFNESFAVAVEVEGVARWIAAHGDEKMRTDFALAQQRRAQFTELVLKYRGELGALYRTPLAPDAMRARKAAAYTDLQQEYRQLRAAWGGYAGYDRFFAGVNNANLASVAIYHALVPQFQRLLSRQGDDLMAFFGTIKKIAALGKEERLRVLAE